MNRELVCISFRFFNTLFLPDKDGLFHKTRLLLHGSSLRSGVSNQIHYCLTSTSPNGDIVLIIAQTKLNLVFLIFFLCYIRMQIFNGYIALLSEKL